MAEQTTKRSMTTDNETSKTSANSKKKKQVDIQMKANSQKCKTTISEEKPESASVLLVESTEGRKGTEGRYRCGSLFLGLVGTTTG